MSLYISLYAYIKESLDEKKKKKSPVELISKSKLLPSDLISHLDEYNKEFKEWFKANCEYEQSTLMDFAKYIPKSENIEDIDIVKWISQNLDSLLGGNDASGNDASGNDASEMDADKTDGNDTDETETPDVKESKNIKESKDEPVKKENILDGTPPVSAIFCHAPEDNEYYCIIWSRLDSNDSNWVKLKEAYKYLKEKEKLDVLTIAPYEMI